MLHQLCTRVKFLWLHFSLTYPLTMIIASLSLVLVCGTGFFCGGLKKAKEPTLQQLYTRATSRPIQYDRFYKSLFRDHRHEDVTLLIRSAENTGITNILRPDLIDFLLRLDQLIKETFCGILAEKKSTQVPNMTLLTEKEQKRIRKTYQNHCLSQVISVKSHPSSDELLDLLKDAALSRRNSTHNSTSNVELPLLDDVLVDIEKRQFIPVHMFLGHILSRECTRHLSATSLDYFSTSTFSRGLIRPDTYSVDLRHSRLHISCVVAAKAIKLTYKSHISASSFSLTLWNETLLAMFSQHGTTRWGPFNISFKIHDPYGDSTMSLADYKNMYIALFTMLVYVVSCFLFHRKNWKMRVFLFSSFLSGTLLSLFSAFGLYGYFHDLLVSTMLLSGCFVVFFLLQNAFIFIHFWLHIEAFYSHPLERAYMSIIENGPKLVQLNIMMILYVALVSWHSSEIVLSLGFCCILGLAINSVLLLTFVIPLIFVTMKCWGKKKEVSAEESNVFTVMTPNDFMTKRYLSFGETLCSLSSNGPYHQPDVMRATHVTGHVDTPVSGSHSFETSLEKVTASWTNTKPQDRNGVLEKHPFVKVCHFLYSYSKFRIFLLLSSLSFFLFFTIYGISHMEMGWKTEDLFLWDTQHETVETLSSVYFHQYGEPTFIAFISQATKWWSPLFQESLKDFENTLLERKLALKIISPLSLLLTDINYRAWLTGGDAEVFEKVLHEAVSGVDTPYYRFRDFFLWKDSHLVAWQMMILPPFSPSATQQHRWYKGLRKVCQATQLLVQHNIQMSFLRTTKINSPRPTQHSTTQLLSPPSYTFLVFWNPFMAIHVFNTDLSCLWWKGLLFLGIQFVTWFYPKKQNLPCLMVQLCLYLFAIISCYGVVQFIQLPFNFITASWLFLSLALCTVSLQQVLSVLKLSWNTPKPYLSYVYAMFFYGLPLLDMTCSGLLSFCFLSLSPSYPMATYSNAFVLGFIVALFYELTCLVLFPITLFAWRRTVSDMRNVEMNFGENLNTKNDTETLVG